MNDVFVVIGIDPVDQQLVVADFGESVDVPRAEKELGDDYFVRRFCLSRDMGGEMFKWFESLGVAESESVELVRQVGRSMKKALEDEA